MKKFKIGSALETMNQLIENFLSVLGRSDKTEFTEEIVGIVSSNNNYTILSLVKFLNAVCYERTKRFNLVAERIRDKSPETLEALIKEGFAPHKASICGKRKWNGEVIRLIQETKRERAIADRLKQGIKEVIQTIKTYEADQSSIKKEIIENGRSFFYAWEVGEMGKISLRVESAHQKLESFLKGVKITVELDPRIRSRVIAQQVLESLVIDYPDCQAIATIKDMVGKIFGV